MSVVTLPNKSLKYMDEEKIEVDIPESVLRIINRNKKHSNKMSKRIEKSKKNYDWKNLYGIAQGIWKDEDVQGYINKLREDRS